MEQKTLAREYSYRRKERFQIPLAAGLLALALAFLLPPPSLVRGAERSAGPERPTSGHAARPRRASS